MDRYASSTVNTQVALLIARELLEACLFVTSYFGAVAKSPHLTQEEKKGYYKYLSIGIVIALAAGLTVSSIIGVVLSKAVEQVDSVAFAIELGEGISKVIAAWFVSGMLFKVPIWFDISNYKDIKKSNKFARADKMGSKWEFGSILFWNTFREFTEAGAITSTIVLLSPTGLSTLGASIGVALAITAVIGITFFLGAKYASVRAFGILGTCLAGILTIGLISGAVHALGEAYGEAIGMENVSGLVYEVTNEDLGSVFAAFEFMGLSDYHTRLSFSVWILATAIVPYSVYRHHYLGKPTFIQSLKYKCSALRGKKHKKSEAESQAENSEQVAEESYEIKGARVNKAGGNADKPKNVNVEFAIPTNTFNPGSDGEVAVKLQLLFPEATFPEGVPTVSVDKVGGGSFPVKSVELVGASHSGKRVADDNADSTRV